MEYILVQNVAYSPLVFRLRISFTMSSSNTYKGSNKQTNVFRLYFIL